MRPLSASEAISPAIARTRLVLFSPFHLGRSWKLCATAYLEMFGQTFFPFHLVYLAFLPAVSRRFGSVGTILFCSGMLLATVLYIWIFYLCSRIKFAYLDIVVNRGQFIAPAWRRFGPQSRRWTGFKILFGCVGSALMSVPTVAYVRHMMPLFFSMSIHPNAQPPAQLMAAIFAGYGLFALFSAVLIIVNGLLGDFIVPPLALENTGIPEAFRRMSRLIRREPGEFTLYVLLKAVLGFASYMGATILMEIAIFIVVAVVAIVLFICGFLMHLAGIPTTVLLGIGVVIGIGFEILLVGYAIMFSIGPVLTFLDAYSLYFLGGRYPLLGDLLDRSEPPLANLYPPAYPPAPFPPPDATPPPAPLAG